MGVYNFKIFWGNGTSVGGIDSNFVIRHDSYIKLLRPDDAKLDNRTGGVVGDILPLRIYLRDTENNESISNAIISFNWTSGTRYLVEVGLGIYDAILDTSDLGSLGLYTIIISISYFSLLDIMLGISFFCTNTSLNVRRIMQETNGVSD